MFKDEDYKIWFFVVLLAVLLVITGMLIAYGQEYLMARRGLCYSFVQAQNFTPQKQWERCK